MSVCSLGCDVGLRGDRTGTWSSRTTYVCSRARSSCGQRLPALGETCLPPEGLQPVCAQESRALRGLCLGIGWHLAGTSKRVRLETLTTRQNFMEAPVYVPQATFYTLQTRPHPSQTELDLKATSRAFAQGWSSVCL